MAFQVVSCVNKALGFHSLLGFFFFFFDTKLAITNRQAEKRKTTELIEKKQQALFSTISLNNILHYPRENSSPHLRVFTSPS